MFISSDLPGWIQLGVEKSDMPISLNYVNLSSWIASLYVIEVKKKSQNSLKCKFASYDCSPGRGAVTFLSLNTPGAIILD